MNSDVCKIKKGEKCGFNFVQAGKSSKSGDAGKIFLYTFYTENENLITPLDK
eukprot:UN01562